VRFPTPFYMLHGFALILVNQLLRHVVISPSMPHALLILGLKIGLMLLLAYLGFRWIECPAREVVTTVLLRQKPRCAGGTGGCSCR